MSDYDRDMRLMHICLVLLVMLLFVAVCFAILDFLT